MSKKEKYRYGSIIFALAMIINPNINVVDLLPDFIGYIIIARAISDACLSTPYFSEAKKYVLRLLWLSVLRLPAFLLIVSVRGGNTLDGDIIVLMTLVFCVAEALLLIFAISNLFSGLFYMGERCNTVNLISDFKLSGKRTSSVDGLKTAAYVFAVLKPSLNFLPELLRLTKTVEIGSDKYIRHLSGLYPFVLLGALLLSLIFGIAYLSYAKKYIIHAASDFEAAAAQMYQYNSADADKKRRVYTCHRALTLLMIASVFSIEVVFDNFHSINILPHAIYGIFITAGIYLSTNETSYAASGKLSVLGTAYSAVSVFALASSISFLSEHTYQDHLLGEQIMAKYMSIIILSAVEFVLLIVLLIVGAMINRKFVLEKTGIPLSDPRYNSADRDFHKSLIARGHILYLIGAITAAAKFVQVLINSHVEIIFTNQNDSNFSSIFTTPLPWWGTVVSALSLIYIVYSFIYYSAVKEEVEYKLGGNFG